MLHPSPASWLALLSLLASGAAVAQTHVHSHSDAPSRAHATAEPAPLAYRSAFDGYRPFADDKPMPWTQANGAAGHSAAHAAMSAEPAGTGKPDPHAGHAIPMAMPIPMPSHPKVHP